MSESSSSSSSEDDGGGFDNPNDVDFKFIKTGKSKKELSVSLRELIQSTTLQGGVKTVLGTCCLVQDNEDSLYHRAEIREVSQDGRVKLFLINVSKVVEVESSNLLKILPENLSQEPSLLIKVSLRGLKPLVSWSEMDKNIAKNVLNLGGETKLQITDPKFVDGKLFINAKNIKGEDLASCLLEYGYPADERTKGKL